jgi:hypothetical protein
LLHVERQGAYVALYVRNFTGTSTASRDSGDTQELDVEEMPKEGTTIDDVESDIDEKTPLSGTLAKMQSQKKKTSSDRATKDVQKGDVAESDSSGTTLLLLLGEAPKNKTRPANWGSCGTFMGRRPPKDPEKRAIFEQKRADWKANQEKKKAQKDDD